MSTFGCLDVTVLAFLLVYLFAVVTDVCYRYFSIRRALEMDLSGKRKVAAVLNIKIGNLKSIAITAPYLGLVGTCEGIGSAFVGLGMEKHAAMVMITMNLVLALTPTAVAMAVAALATCFYNFLSALISSFEDELFSERRQRHLHFGKARKLSSGKRLSELPALGLMAAPVLVFAIAPFMMSASYQSPTGFYAELASDACKYESHPVDRIVVLRITETGTLFLNLEEEKRDSLGKRLAEIYSRREDRTLYLSADSGVDFGAVANVLDIVENVPATERSQAVGVREDKLGIKIRLITPKTFDAGSPGSGLTSCK